MQPGTEVAGYRIESRLGHGGMGIVYEATQLSLNRRVALKILSPQLGDDQVFRRRFQREGEIQAAIDHPHIVTVYEAGEVDDGLFLAMRLVRGGTLKDMIITQRLEGARTLRLLGPIADALDTAHEAGLIHRDVKPQNILVGEREHPYLADFGLTRRNNESALTRSGRFVGSIDYISPEAIRGELATRASDIYSLAAVLFECVSGVVPYPRPSDAAVLYSHLSDPPPRLSDRQPGTPAALDEVIARGMAKDPAARYARASELIRDAGRAFDTPARSVRRRVGPRAVSDRRTTRVARDETPATIADGTTQSGEVVGIAASTIADRRVAESAVGPASTPAPSRRTRRTTRRWPAIAATATATAALALTGFAVGQSRRGGPAALSGSASSAAVEVHMPANWDRRASTPSLPGLDLTDAMAVGPHARQGNGLVVGRTGPTGKGLLPDSMTGRVRGIAPHAQRVMVGAMQALRYEDLHVMGTPTPYDLTLAPTSRGTMAFACHAAPAQLAQMRADCARVMSSAELLIGSPASVDPSPGYAASISRVVSDLSAARRRDRSSLARAESPRQQAAAARALRDDYATATRRARAAHAPPRAGEIGSTLIYALTATRAAYARLASAIDHHDGAAYAAAARSVHSGETSVQHALAAFAREDYRVS